MIMPVELVANIVGFVMIVLSATILTDMLGARGLLERLLTTYILLISIIVVVAYVLSLMYEINNLFAWSIVSSAIFCLGVVLRSARPSSSVQKGVCLQRSIDIKGVLKHISQCSRADRLILCITVPSAIALGAYSFFYLCMTAPNNWDSMTYNLARMAY